MELLDQGKVSKTWDRLDITSFLRHASFTTGLHHRPKEKLWGNRQTLLSPCAFRFISNIIIGINFALSTGIGSYDFS